MRKARGKVREIRRAFNSTLPAPSKPLDRKSVPKRGGKLKAVGAGKAKRVARNAEYYRSAEWRDVKKRTHEVDGYQCRRMISIRTVLTFMDEEQDLGTREQRCENTGEVVNGKMTARGLVCDELSYGRRGDGSKGSGNHEPGITTRSLCKRCNEIETTSKRANHARGFNNRA